MPELPEVETVRAGLCALLELPVRIRSYQARRLDLREALPPSGSLDGLQWERIERRGKYLLFVGQGPTLVNHLGMTGSWRLLQGEPGNHDHALFVLDDGRRLVFRDPRRFGLLRPLLPEDPALRVLGPEPLGPDFTAKALHARCQRRNSAIKAVIMDQQVVVGVGNIYAAEALFRAGIAPTMAASALSRARLQRLVDAIRAVLNEAIAAGGSTISDYRQAGGANGCFQHRFQVYDRAGQPCLRCQHPLTRTVIAARSSVWCPRCQR